MPAVVPICVSYSADVAPRMPELKLSRNLTVSCSSGTVVPPDCSSQRPDGAHSARGARRPSPCVVCVVCVVCVCVCACV